jgi:hypothetical protein
VRFRTILLRIHMLSVSACLLSVNDAERASRRNKEGCLIGSDCVATMDTNVRNVVAPSVVTVFANGVENLLEVLTTRAHSVRESSNLGKPSLFIYEPT